jgi:ABC-type multidrug transport system ATPase subunit
MFDRLMLLAKGKVIYFNEAQHAVEYFAKINYRCPELSNPSDYFMAIMSIETIEHEDTDGIDAGGQTEKLDVAAVYERRI